MMSGSSTSRSAAAHALCRGSLASSNARMAPVSIRARGRIALPAFALCRQARVDALAYAFARVRPLPQRNGADDFCSLRLQPPLPRVFVFAGPLAPQPVAGDALEEAADARLLRACSFL